MSYPQPPPFCNAPFMRYNLLRFAYLHANSSQICSAKIIHCHFWAHSQHMLRFTILTFLRSHHKVDCQWKLILDIVISSWYFHLVLVAFLSLKSSNGLKSIWIYFKIAKNWLALNNMLSLSSTLYLLKVEKCGLKAFTQYYLWRISSRPL